MDNEKFAKAFEWAYKKTEEEFNPTQPSNRHTEEWDEWYDRMEARRGELIKEWYENNK